MNDPEATTVAVEEEQQWLLDHKSATGMSWTELASRAGIPAGTLSQFAPAKYQGDNARVARAIFRYRQLLASQAELAGELPDLPGYFETPTSRRVESLLAYAQRGRITLIVGGAGISKTITAGHYAEAVANVWVATMRPSSAGVNNMQIAVLKSMGQPDARGTPQALSSEICARVRNTGGLIVIDEAQHLSEKAIEEIRSWHDETGIGIALLGNETVLGRMEGGSRKPAYAQLYSRVGMRLIQNVPSRGDADALADAWEIDDARSRAFVVQKAQLPGGMRGATMMLELGAMLAKAEGGSMQVAHLQDAWAQLSTRQIAA